MSITFTEWPKFKSILQTFKSWHDISDVRYVAFFLHAQIASTNLFKVYQILLCITRAYGPFYLLLAIHIHISFSLNYYLIITLAYQMHNTQMAFDFNGFLHAVARAWLIGKIYCAGTIFMMFMLYEPYILYFNSFLPPFFIWEYFGL